MADLFTNLQSGLADRYTLERELGRGGMATVYLARDLRHKRPVALKVLHPELAYVLGTDRFLREIEVAANLTHPHILPLHDSGEVESLLYYVMPYIEGESLRDRLRRETQLAVEDALQIAREVADALAYAHKRGVVHRDIKPENILLHSGHALVADFGIAQALWQADSGRLTETGLAVGTAAYMSPEQASGARQVDGRSDIYSLGCVLYEMLAGEPPYTGPTPQAIMAKRFRDPVPSVRRLRTAIPLALDRALALAMEQIPADRFSSAQQFADTLKRMSPTGSSPSSIDTRTLSWPFWGKHRLSRRGAIAIAAIIVLGMVALATGFWMRRTPSRPLDPNVVVVAPFRVSGVDTALGYLSEGMVDLLAAKLTGQGGPRAADPRSVLSAWRQGSASDRGELPRESALELAKRLGAGQLLMGNVVGGPGRVTLNASVLAVPDGRTRAETSVEGPVDSLSGLVDQLAAKLLTLGAGESEQRLVSVTSTSLPAVRSYLEGQALFRRGHYVESASEFDRALQLDSTFGLAALGLLAAGMRTGEYEAVSRGEALAYAARDRLNPRDLAYLMVLMGMSYSDTTPYSELLHRAERFAAIAPDRAEAYATLGEVLYNFGEMIGISTAHQRAGAAYRRALELDSTYAPALDNLLFISARAGDTATVRRVKTLYGKTDPSKVVRWRMGVALGDQLALRRLRASFDSTEVIDLLFIGQLSQYDGVSLEDAELGQQIALRRESRSNYRGAVLAEMATLALNRGRPSAALAIRQQQEALRVGPQVYYTDMHRVLDALYWDGDTVAGAIAARRLEVVTDSLLPQSDFRGRIYRCALEQWRIAHSQLGAVVRTVSRLRTKGPQDDRALTLMFEGCATLLETLLAAAQGRSDAAARLEQLDSLMRSGPPYRNDHQAWNLVVARLREGQGDLTGALAATRRRLYFLAEPLYLSTYLREEGRLAALTGDRDGAIRAYQHYLVLRADPEPAIRPRVEQVRAALAELLNERGK